MRTFLIDVSILVVTIRLIIPVFGHYYYYTHHYSVRKKSLPEQNANSGVHNNTAEKHVPLQISKAN